MRHRVLTNHNPGDCARDGGKSRAGYTLVEILVVIGIIGFLIALLLPTFSRAMRSAKTVQCGSNLRQIYNALAIYLNENQGMTFWRAPDIDIDGMEWYVYGGRETGNLCLDQQGLFNRIIPRPLNKYVSNSLSVFRCPEDVEGGSPWTSSGVPHHEWVGTSYNFNANGDPEVRDPDSGLSGVRFTQIRDSSRTVLFLDAAHVWGYNYLGYTAPWHPQRKANVCFADGHVDWIERPTSEPGKGYLWGVQRAK